MSTGDRTLVSFHDYVASSTIGSVLEQNQQAAAQAGGAMTLVDGTVGIRISAMVLVTCVRAGLKHPTAIPLLLYPDDTSMRQRFTSNPNLATSHVDVPAMLKMHKTQKEAYKEHSGDEPGILMAMLTHAAASSGVDFAEFLGDEVEFPLVELFNVATACGHGGLVLVAIDENEARNLAAEAQGAPWNFDEAGHVKYTDSLLQSYQGSFHIELP